MKSFLKAYAVSINWVNCNPATAGALVEKHAIGMKTPVAEAAIPRCNLRYAGAASARASVSSFLQVLLDFAPESIGGKLPDDAFYYQE